MPKILTYCLLENKLPQNLPQNLPFNVYLIGIFTHLKLCLPDAIHTFKRLKIIEIWQNGVNDFEIVQIDVTFYLFESWYLMC